MGGFRRVPSKRYPSLFPCSPRVLLSFCLFLVYLFSLARGVSLRDGGGEVVDPVPQQGDENEEKWESDADAINASAANRVKRSRESQQLCGYRLLDALRNVCDRNFVGYSRRSDPSFLGTFASSSGDSQSGEDVYVGSSNMYPWDLALLNIPYPHSAPSLSASASDMLLNPVASSNSVLGREGPIMDYLEMLPAHGNGRATSSSKAFALKMLAEPPKAHQRFRRTIIDECCKKPCAMTQMLKYCGMAKRNF